MPLSRIGPYRLLRLLQSGGEGDVYVAEDTRLARRVAVKLKPLQGDAAERTRAVDEARALAAFSDPQIVHVHDVIELDEQLAIIMEYVDGQDLETLSRDQRLSLPTALALGHDICSALAAAHQRGLCHGDLKLANVLVTPEARIKLTDFGCCGISPSATAPEQRRGETADPRSDLFALGCLLHSLLLGQVDPVVRMGCDTRGLLKSSNLPAALKGLLESLLQGQPAARPGSAVDVRMELLSLSREYPSGYAELLATVERCDRKVQSVAPDTVTGPQKKANRDGPWLRWVLSGGVAFALFLAALSLRPAQTLPLSLESVRWEGASPGLRREIDMLLLEVVQGMPGVNMTEAPGAQARLSVTVQCNDYSCVSTLTLKEQGRQVSDTRALLPDSDVQVWQKRLQQGLVLVLAQR